LPADKPNRKICWDEQILVQEIENRYADMEVEEGEEDSYEIEIVDDDGDADFYLEIVDGEVFYVFETEDDISDEEESDDEDDESTMTGGDVSTGAHSEIVEESDNEMSPPEGGTLPSTPVQVPTSMALPSLDEDSSTDADSNLLPEETRPAVIEPDCASLDVKSAQNNSEEEPTRMNLSGDDTGSEVFSMKSIRPQSHNVSSAIEYATSADMASPTQGREQLSPAPSHASVEPETLTGAAVISGSPSTTCSSGYITPIQKKKDSVQIFVVDMVPSSPSSTPVPPLSPGNASTLTPRSILKACPESPKKHIPPKKPRDKSKPKEKKEKTFTKTYVRAEQYNCETTVSYAWEKPSWTSKQLRSTDKGEQVRSGGNLANPITFPKKLPANADLLQEEGLEIDGVAYEQVDKEELIRRLKGGSHGRHRKLKFSINGAKIRDGGDIVQPITQATVFRKPENINRIANQDVLKKSAIGDAVKEGKNLAQPVTFATVNKTFQWEKPEWAKRLESKKEAQETTDEGSATYSSSGFVSPSKQKKTYTWEKPSWTKQRLAPTENGDVVKDGASLAMPITLLPDLVRQDEQQRLSQKQ
jgi:hypothetical protein